MDCGWNGSAQQGHSDVSTHPVQLQAFKPVKASLDFGKKKKKSHNNNNVAFCGGFTGTSVSVPTGFYWISWADIAQVKGSAQTLRETEVIEEISTSGL